MLKALSPLIPGLSEMADRSDGEISTTESISGGSIESSEFIETEEQPQTVLPQTGASVDPEIAKKSVTTSAAILETMHAAPLKSGATPSTSSNVWNASATTQIENTNATALDIRSMLSEFTSKIEASQKQITDSMITESKLRDVMQTEVLVPLKESIQKADERITKIETEHGLKIEAHEKAISDTNQRLQTTITSLTTQIESLKKSAATTAHTSINPAMLSRQNNLVIAGIPEVTPSASEDINATIKAIAEELDCTISSIKARRLGKLDANKPNKVRQVLVEFSSHWEKRKFHSARSKLKNSANYSHVFFNEDLDKRSAELFFKGRSAKKSGRIKSIWTYGCQVFFSKHGSSEPIHLTDEEQLPPPTTVEAMPTETAAQTNAENPAQPAPAAPPVQ